MDDEFHLGKKYSTDGYTAHYYCLLFACGLQQNGDDEEGIFGFLSQDIRKELYRASKLRCSFCKQKGAATGCLLKKCRATYHLPCGLVNHSLCQFHGTFPSLCRKHRPNSNELAKKSKQLDEERCYICLENILDSENLSLGLDLGDKTNKISIEPLAPEETHFRLLLTPCCKKWLHLNCLQKQAYNAGLYFIKCPLCNDKENFKTAIVDHGIYVPDKDASWEESNGYNDLERRYEHCDATNCACPKGSNHVDDSGSWELYVCWVCGSKGVHLGCLPIEMQADDAPDWVCEFCLAIDSRIEEKRKCIKNKPPVAEQSEETNGNHLPTGSNEVISSPKTNGENKDLQTLVKVESDSSQPCAQENGNSAEDQPSIDQSSIDQPSIVQPSMDQPLMDQPLMDQPSMDQPLMDQPLMDQPTIDQPLIDQPPIDQPSIDQQLIDISNTENVECAENGSNRRRSRSPAISRLQDENLPFRSMFFLI